MNAVKYEVSRSAKFKVKAIKAKATVFTASALLLSANTAFAISEADVTAAFTQAAVVIGVAVAGIVTLGAALAGVNLLMSLFRKY